MKSILLALVFALAVSAVSAHEYKAGSLEIKHPWARATPKGATVAGGYMKIINTGTAPDRLVGGSTGRPVCQLFAALRFDRWKPAEFS